MKLGMVGLGKMGANMARRLMRAGHEVVGCDRDAGARRALAEEGAAEARDLESLVKSLGDSSGPRLVWLMLPSGEATSAAVHQLGMLLGSGDLVVNGANSRHTDDRAYARVLADHGVHFVDAGVSGGVWGLEKGYCLMLGGAPEAVAFLEPVLEALAPGMGDIPRTPRRGGEPSPAERGWLHCGAVGSGHFVKMVHNGIEYGLMQAYAEGFDLLRRVGSERVPEARRYELPLADIAEVWRRSSVIRSWLLDLLAESLAEDPELAAFTGYVEDTGEGRWTVEAALEAAVPLDVISAALFARFRSRRSPTFGDQALAAMRYRFGGHEEPGVLAGQGAGGASAKVEPPVSG